MNTLILELILWGIVTLPFLVISIILLNGKGANLIAGYYIHGNTVYLLSIYDKSERVTIIDSELAELLDSIANV